MREVRSLSGNHWRLAELPLKVSPPKFQPDRWVPAQVPGNVQWDLQRAGIIPDPFVSTQNRECLWVQWKDWLMETDFPATKLGSDSVHQFLHFYATDYETRFYLDDTFLGAHRGMFGDSWFDISALLQKNANKTAHLRVALKNSPRNRRSALKCQMSYGWDFAPPIVTMGIWDDVELVSVGHIWIQNWFFRSRVIDIQGEHGSAEITCDVYLQNLANKSLDAKITINEPELGVLGIQQVVLGPGISKVTIGPAFVEAGLWFPNEMGAQKVYDATITVEAGGEVTDQVTECRFGVRDLQMRSNPGSPVKRQPWTFVVNAQPTFIRGANWVPPDSYFGRISKGTYEHLIKLAQDAHMNMFRVWGGGIREKRWFYDLCDQAGILLWQEFPFGCANYPNDPVFLKLVQRECSNTVQRIWNHPSLAIYVGGNEFDPDYNRHLVNVLKDCAAQDPTRAFYDASPCKGDEHNWMVWHSLANFAAYKLNYQFASEFGLQSAPCLETVQEMLKPDEIWPVGPAWAYHHAQINKLQRYGSNVCAQEDVRKWIFSTQVAQAEGLKYGIEYFRRNKWHFSGVLFWQLNEPWPTTCWSVIDYFGRPKLAYEYLKQIYNPLLGMLDYTLQADSLGAKAFISNDFPTTFNDLTVRVESIEGVQSRDIFSTSASIAPFGTHDAGAFNYTYPSNWSLKDKFRWQLRVTIQDNKGKLLSENSYKPFLYRERSAKPLWWWKIADKGRELGWAKIPQIWEWSEIDHQKA